MGITSTDLTIGMTRNATTTAVLFADEERPLPPVLFVVDVFGVRERTLEMARHIAEQGYAVLVPHILYRQGAVGELFEEGMEREAEMGRANELVSSFTPRNWSDDLPLYLDTLAHNDHTTEEPTRVVGYCMGGTMALRAAVLQPERIARVAGFHPGGLVTRHLDSPHRQLHKVQCPVFMAYADNDRSMTADGQAAMQAAAEEAGVDFTGVLYEGAEHGFTMSDRLARYDEAATERHWQDLFAFFSGSADSGAKPTSEKKKK